MYVTFERQTLFEEVWQTPLTTLSKKYGLSDNGLRKICKSLGIPLPKAGHWAKLAVGKAVARPKLPPAKDKTTYQSWRQFDPAIPSTKRQSDAEWLRERQEYEAIEDNAVSVVAKPRKWHPAVEPLRAWLLKCIEEYRTALKKQAESKKRSKAGKHGIEHYYADWDVRQHEPILGSTHKSAAMRVSLQTYERALSIFNALAFAAEKRGFEVTYGDGRRERLFFRMEDALFGLYITEHLDTVVKTVGNPWNSETSEKSIAISSGRMRLNVERPGYGVMPVNDAEGSPIESNLNKVFFHAYRYVVREREETRRREFIQQQEDEKKRIRDEAEQKRKEVERLKAEEEQRRANLINQSEGWHQSNRIRQLVHHVQASSTIDQSSAKFGEWRTWAMAVADSIDPTASLSIQFSEKKIDA
jgi:hypothetical protein